MQNADCRMQMQNAQQMQIALQNCRAESTQKLSETACAPEALGRILSLTRIPLGLGYWAKGTWETFRMLFGGALGGLFHVLGVSWRGPGEGQKGPGEALEASWRPLGELLEAS